MWCRTTMLKKAQRKIIGKKKVQFYIENMAMTWSSNMRSSFFSHAHMISEYILEGIGENYRRIEEYFIWDYHKKYYLQQQQ